MSGEAQAFGKIVDGIKELGETLFSTRPAAPRPPTAQPNNGEGGLYMVPKVLIDELRDAWEDDGISRHVPMGMARPVTAILRVCFKDVT